MNNSLYYENFPINISVSHNITTSWKMHNFHFHHVFEIYLTMSDHIQYFVNDRVYHVSKRDLLIFNHEDLHKVVLPDTSENFHYERYILVFDPEYIKLLSTTETDLLECFLKRDSNFCHIRHLSPDQYEGLLALLNRAKTHFDSPVYGSDIHTKILLAEILLHINLLYKNKSGRRNSTSDTPLQKKVSPIIRYINQNLKEDLSLDRLSKIFYISKYHMNVLFRKATGFSINEYVINRRILKAQEYLKAGHPTCLILEWIGFHNEAHFIRTFKKLVGQPPKKWLKSCTGNT